MNRWVLVALCLLAFSAHAADMQDCSAAGRDYRTLSDQVCLLLCKGVKTTSSSPCGPSSLPAESWKGRHTLTVGIGNADAACITGTFSIDWCPGSTCAAPSVPQTFASLTGATTSDTSSQSFPTIPSRFYQARFSAIADPNCDNNGGIDIFILLR